MTTRTAEQERLWAELIAEQEREIAEMAASQSEERAALYADMYEEKKAMFASMTANVNEFICAIEAETNEHIETNLPYQERMHWAAILKTSRGMALEDCEHLTAKLGEACRYLVQQIDRGLAILEQFNLAGPVSSSMVISEVKPED